MSFEDTNVPPGTDGEAPASPPVPFAPKPELPEDLRTPWAWPDLLFFLIFGFGGIVVLTNLMAVVAMAWLGVRPHELGQLETKSAVFVTARQALWSALLMFYLFVLVRVRGATPFWRTMGWRPLAARGAERAADYLLYPLGGSVLAIAIQFASAFIGTKAKLPIEAFFQDRQSVLLLMAMGILVAPVVEETVFRGYVYPVLARSFGVAGGVLATGALFGLLHAPQLWGGWGQIALLMLVGTVFTYVRARTGTVLASYLLHLGYNGILFLGFYFSTGGLRHFPTSS